MTTVASSVSTNLNELFSRVTALETLARENLPAHLRHRITAPATQQAGTYTSDADVANALADLAGRVATLEALAHDHLGAPLPQSRTVETVSVPETPTPEPTPAPVVITDAHGTHAAVDYPAVAYGLTSTKSKIQARLGRSAELDREYAGMVEWYVACFAGDSAFNAAAFRRDAGV
jgi:hypothetical protein